MRWIVREDIDGFFGLMTDNLMQLIVIGVLCQQVCGISPEKVFGTILPGAAISIFIGNIFYTWQARRCARRKKRNDVTALPFGINTPSLFAFVFLVMLPVKIETGDPELAWKVGLLACLGSGIIELVGSFFAEHIRKHTPRAALLSALSGIAITFIAMDFALRIFSRPLLAFLPLAIILLEYFARIKFPFALPGGLVALSIGTIIAWSLQSIGFNYMDTGALKNSLDQFQLILPQSSVKEIYTILTTDYFWKYFSIIFPMGIINVIGSLQNIESAEAAGDCFPTMPSLAVNGIGTIVAAFLGSCFPTTIYIGHAGWKALGARTGYSILNGFFIVFICLSGSVNLIFNLIPIEAGAAIVLWIGIIITVQAFQSTPAKHAPAVGFGLFPAVAAYSISIMEKALAVAGTTWKAVGLASFITKGFFIEGMIALERGFILNSMIWSAIVVYVIEKDFFKAGFWGVIASGLSFVGIIHAFKITESGIVNNLAINAALPFSIGYLLLAVAFYLTGLKLSKGSQK
ncbi:MAG: NCS2 family permease [Desulfobacterota bacterium]|nr:NCS2 family permease [Thermodesulfobacteriota bacterium]